MITPLNSQSHHRSHSQRQQLFQTSRTEDRWQFPTAITSQSLNRRLSHCHNCLFPCQAMTGRWSGERRIYYFSASRTFRAELLLRKANHLVQQIAEPLNGETGVTKWGPESAQYALPKVEYKDCVLSPRFYNIGFSRRSIHSNLLALEPSTD